MHNSEVTAGGAPEPEPEPARGAQLLLELGRLIVRARDLPSTSRDTAERLLPRALLKLPEGWDGLAGAGGAEPAPGLDAAAVGEAVSRAQRALLLDAQLSSHVQTLWAERAPMCIEVLLAGSCALCGGSGAADALLLERWTLALRHKKCEGPPLMTPQWLLNAVRSQLHFSQISAWRAKLRRCSDAPPDPQERQRRRSRETCNYKKLESNCDEEELGSSADSREDQEWRRLNVVYRARTCGDAHAFSRAPVAHRFPLADIAPHHFLEVVLESLPRTEEIPAVRCGCLLSKRRASRDSPSLVSVPPEELAARLGDLTLGPSVSSALINSNIGCSSHKLSMFTSPEYRHAEYQDLAGSVQLDHPYSSPSDNIVRANYLLVDDRMHTQCSESGKHKCSCDEESDAGRLDERRLKELAKYKRRMRKESRMRRISGDEPSTGIPILQAARFDRMRALGCLRSRNYVPSGLADSRRTASVATQTDDLPHSCQCGRPLETNCDNCRRRLVRSEASYDLARASRRRERDDTSQEQALKKHKCDRDCEASVRGLREEEHVIKRPKLRRALVGTARRIQRVVSDRSDQHTGTGRSDDRDEQSDERVDENSELNGDRRQNSDDIDELLLRDDDSVFAHMAHTSPTPAKTPQRSSSTDEELVMCDYGTFDRYESPDSPEWERHHSPLRDADEDKQRRVRAPSPRESDRFRYRLDSAASMLFHSRTGLPLTSSPAPLRRGHARFDYDNTITDIHGIKSALFHPVSPPEGWWSPGSSPGSPAPAPTSPPPAVSVPALSRRRRSREPRLTIPPASGLLGSFEESALHGRLEPTATVDGFTAELGASGEFCPPHRRLPVTVFFYALGGTTAPYLGHINLGATGYRVPRAGTVQVSLFNPHGTLVKMFVVLYELGDMPACARTFLRQRTLYVPSDLAAPPSAALCYRSLRYLIHLRFLTSKTGKLYLHTDIRIIVSRKADLDTAAAHMPLHAGPSPLSSIPSTNQGPATATCHSASTNHIKDSDESQKDTYKSAFVPAASSSRVSRVFGGGSLEEAHSNSENLENPCDIGPFSPNNRLENVSYELRSFTYAPENPKYSPR